MKIFHAIDSGGFYGAEVMLVNLVAEQLKQGLKPVIVSVGALGIEDKALEIEARKRGLPVQVFRMRPGLNFMGAKQLLHYCQSQKFDLIHSHGYKCNVLLGPLPRCIRKTPMLSTVHGWTTTTGFTKMRIYEWLDALSLRFVDGVVLVNKEMLHNPKIARLNSKKIFVVDNGIPVDSPDTSQLDPLDPEIEVFCQDGFVIGSIGRYSVEKGFDILLQAFSAIRDQIGNAKLLLIGEGGQRNLYESIIKENNLSDCVLLTGYCSNAWRYLDLLNVYVISSLTEGLPITLLEAMRSKVPVVSTRVGGIPDVLQGELGGQLVQPGKGTALAQAIIGQYLEPEKTEEKVLYCHRRFSEKYSSLKMSEKYHAIYEKVLAG